MQWQISQLPFSSPCAGYAERDLSQLRSELAAARYQTANAKEAAVKAVAAAMAAQNDMAQLRDRLAEAQVWGY